jgi:hypothetical protein
VTGALLLQCGSANQNREAIMPISISIIVVSSQLVVTVADNAPKFDIARNCKLDVVATTGLSVGQPVKSCITTNRKRGGSSQVNGPNFLLH